MWSFNMKRTRSDFRIGPVCFGPVMNVTVLAMSAMSSWRAESGVTAVLLSKEGGRLLRRTPPSSACTRACTSRRPDTRRRGRSAASLLGSDDGCNERFRSGRRIVTVAAELFLPRVADVHRMAELDSPERHTRRVLLGLLREHDVARVAVVGEHLAALRDVLAVVAAETPEEVHVPDVVRKRLPARPHRREVIAGVDALHLRNHLRNCRLLVLRNHRIAAVIVVVDDGLDAVLRSLLARVGVLERGESEGQHQDHHQRLL